MGSRRRACLYLASACEYSPFSQCEAASSKIRSASCSSLEGIARSVIRRLPAVDLRASAPDVARVSCPAFAQAALFDTSVPPVPEDPRGPSTSLSLPLDNISSPTLDSRDCSFMSAPRLFVCRRCSVEDNHFSGLFRSEAAEGFLALKRLSSLSTSLVSVAEP